MIQDFWVNALFSLAPTVLIGLIFWFVLRSIIRSDRSERKAYSTVEAEERKKLGMPPVDQDPFVQAGHGSGEPADTSTT
jgi:flagellar biosynthesis/type III secretory pathway M-ring protein FliF/YscJ